MTVQADINDVAQQYKAEFLASQAKLVEMAATLGVALRKVEALTKEVEDLKSKLPAETTPQA